MRVGEPCPVNIAVRNDGESDFRGTVVAYFYDSETNALICKAETEPASTIVAAGATATATVTPTFPKDGEFTVVAWCRPEYGQTEYAMLTDTEGNPAKFQLRAKQAGVAEIGVPDMRIYPNPASDVATIEGIPSGATVEIYAVSGVKVKGSDCRRHVVANLRERHARRHVFRSCGRHDSQTAETIKAFICRSRRLANINRGRRLRFFSIANGAFPVLLPSGSCVQKNVVPVLVLCHKPFQRFPALHHDSFVQFAALGRGPCAMVVASPMIVIVQIKHIHHFRFVANFARSLKILEGMKRTDDFEQLLGFRQDRLPFPSLRSKQSRAPMPTHSSTLFPSLRLWQCVRCIPR